MATLFFVQPGTVTAVVDNSDTGLPLRVDTIQGSWFPGFRSILTEASFALDENFQFSHTLRQVIYEYVFGSRISQVRIGGLCFANDCGGGGYSGIESMLQWYEANKISSRAKPLQLQIGAGSGGRFRGALTNFRADLVRPEARISQFAFILHVFPVASKGRSSPGA